MEAMEAMEKQPTQEKLLLTVREAAELMGISTATMYNVIHIVGFPTIRLGRKVLISREGLIEWVRAQTPGMDLRAGMQERRGRDVWRGKERQRKGLTVCAHGQVLRREALSSSRDWAVPCSNTRQRML